MTKIEIKDAAGKADGSVELNPAVFAIEPNVPVTVSYTHLTLPTKRIV